MDTDRMNHEDFVQRYRSGKIGVRVDRNKAGFFYEKPGLMPQSLRKKQALLRAAAFGGVALGLALFLFVDW